MGQKSLPRVYLDNCALQRPFDDRAQVRVALEAEAVLSLVALWESDQIHLVASDVLEFEASRMPGSERKTFAFRLIKNVSEMIGLTREIINGAKAFEDAGISAYDALHLASAVEAEVDYFVTTDDRLHRKASLADTRLTRVVTPLELVQLLDL